MCNLTIYETCEGKVMARGSKGLKIRELLKAHPTSSHHESPGRQNDVDTQEKQSQHRGKTVMANVWTSTEKIVIKVDKYGVPCTKDAATLSSFLGVLAKNGAYALINILNWRHEDFTHKAKWLKLLMVIFFNNFDDAFSFLIFHIFMVNVA